MENSGEDLSSSTANHSFSGDGSAAGSDESGWTSYIDYFMETQRRQKAKGEASLSAEALSTDNVGGYHSTSENSGDCGVGASTRLPVLLEPSAVSKRLSLKEGWRRRKKKVLYDESLEDTATSPISSPKLIELRDSDATHQKKDNSRDEILHSKKNTTGDVNGANTTTDTTIKEDGAYDNNELRKKGLCLVPVSAFRV
ncbi:hypothetical protein HU200_051057 [Digitaria exilis]|uniref:Uncharacterized protein n=1 Tax=Digitaria exilis TaxID=1010633 RepID=A0A835E705_9POAL|nr:hypothetical protein HU200_051057 [Digitaria exilis]CAB3479893.1 unnamed protein product [Digitaria exilis]